MVRRRRDHRLEHVGHAGRLGHLGQPSVARLVGPLRAADEREATTTSASAWPSTAAARSSGRSSSSRAPTGPAPGPGSGPRATPRADTLSTASTSPARASTMTIKWSGSDVRLQVLTAGLRYFQVQGRREGIYDWRYTKSATTTRRSWSATCSRARSTSSASGPRTRRATTALVAHALDQALIDRARRRPSALRGPRPGSRPAARPARPGAG